MQEDKTKSYIISEKLKYLGLGSIIGLVLSLNNNPTLYVAGFVLLTIVLGVWLKKK